jgi:hypothetical protein
LLAWVLVAVLIRLPKNVLGRKAIGRKKIARGENQLVTSLIRGESKGAIAGLGCCREEANPRPTPYGYSAERMPSRIQADIRWRNAVRGFQMEAARKWK